LPASLVNRRQFYCRSRVGANFGRRAAVIVPGFN